MLSAATRRSDRVSCRARGTPRARGALAFYLVMTGDYRDDGETYVAEGISEAETGICPGPYR
jgi:hypothetical protein